jgi:hypothetical protein
MSSPDPTTADDEQPSGSGTSGPDPSAAGVEIGRSEDAGGTFEPEEDPEADG